MATVRIQVRRGTATQWTTANPILAAGEMGVESDTNRFKFGNGTSNWSDLNYAASDATNIAEISQDAINEALTLGDGLTKTYNDGANTITIAVVDSYFIDLAKDAANDSFQAADGLKKSYSNGALTVDVDLETNGGLKINGGKLAVDTDVTITTTAEQNLYNKNLENPSVNGVEVVVSGTEINRLNGLTKNINESYVDILNDANDYTDTAISTLGNTVSNGYIPVSLLGQNEGVAQLDVHGHVPMSQINLVDADLTGSTTVEDLEVSGTLVFNGTATQINSTNLNITDPLIYMGNDNPANTVDLGFVSSFTENSTYQHTGLVRDHATNTWVLFKGVTDEPTTTVNLSQGSLDSMAVGHLTATSLDVGNVSNTEFGYLNGVTGGIQGQLDLKAPLESPTFTGIVVLPNQTITSAMIADNTITESDIHNSAITANKLATDSVTTSKIVDTNVTTAKIADSAITSQKIADEAIVSGKIAAGAIVTADLADGAITVDKLGPESVTSAKIANGTIVNGDISATAAIDWSKLLISSTITSTEVGHLHNVTSDIQPQLDSKLPLAGGTMTGDLILSGVPTSNSMAANKGYVDTLISGEVTNRNSAIADEATARDTAISSAVSTHNSNTTTAHGVSGAVVGTTNTQTLTNKTLTSPVINNPTGITKSDVGLANVNNTSDANKPVSTATQTALDLKANLDAPTFTGTVVLPSTTSIGDVSATELGYLDGVTSSIQTQISSKLSSATAASTYAPIASPTFTGTVSGVTKSMVGLGNVDNTSDANKPISTATQSALDLKAPLASPTFTGTVSGITKSMVGLGNVDNTSDANKPISTATQTALDLKAPLASPTFTGTVTLPTGTVTSGMILDGTIVNADINASAGISLSKLATDPLARANHTGTQTASTISDFDTQVRTSRLDQMSNPTASVSMNSQKITNVATPTSDNDAANKAYVDAAVQNINIHEAVVAATTANVNLTNAVDNNKVLDGYTLKTGDRILVKNQSTASQNGIYIVASNGAPTRATDYDVAGEVSAGDFIFVENGTVNSNTGWVQTAVVTTVGTDPLSFTQFSGAGTFTAGTGLSLSGTTFAIDSTVTTLTGTQTLTNKTLTSPTLTTPALGTPSAAVLTNATGLPLTTGVTGTLPVANGGTGITSFGTGVATALGTNVGSSGAFITNGGALGTPTSGTLTNATGLPISTGVSGLGTGVATFLATPSSSNLASAITDETGSGALVFATSPTLVTPTIGVATATSVNGTTIPTSKTLVVTTDKLSVHAATTSAELAGVISDETGTGALVFANSPTLVTPALGTPASGVLTNATGLPLTTGVTGTLPVANGGTGATASTGSGNVVLATSPTLVTPTLGAASATSIAFSDGTQSKEGVPSRTPINGQTGTTYTTVLTDRDSLVECNNASAITVTIPPNSSVAYPVGTSIDILQTGAGQVTIAAGAGVTVNATPGLKLRSQWSSATLFKRATDTWVVMGDLSA